MAEDFHPELYPVLVEPSGHVVGYAHCSVTPGDTHGKIHHIAVLPDYQGRRLGKALLNHCIRTLAEQGVEVVQLSVESDNPTAALTMYQNAGFETYREWIRYTLELSGISNSR
jgi:[ribosomal protein S18]-alanine N-acetyltransferase